MTRRTPPISPKLSFRVSGARPGSLVRPTLEAETRTDTTAIVPLLKQPRFGLRVHSSPLAPAPSPTTADDYATAEDYE